MNKFLLSFLALLMFSKISAGIPCCGADLEVGYSTGKYISIDEDYAEVGLFAPFAISSGLLTFLDAKAYRFNNGKWAASAGVGFRNCCSKCNAFGLNVFYDYRRGDRENNFNQLGVGFEWLTSCWDFRANGYFCVGPQVQTSEVCTFDNLGGGFFASNRKKQFAYNGFDAELGFWFFESCDFSLYGAGGPYYYNSGNRKNFWGWYGRAELDWRSIVALQVVVSNDKFHDTCVQGIINVYLPFEACCPSSCCCEELLTQKIHRNGIILLDRCCDWVWNWIDVD